MLQWALEHTNLRIAGGYVAVHGRGAPAWHGLLEPVWLQGFGLSLFDASAWQPDRWTETSTDGGHLWRGVPPRAPTVADGESEAQAVVAHARAEAPNLARAVIYIDNEDNADDVTTVPPSTTQTRTRQTGVRQLLDYYRGLFYWLERQPPDRVRIRPGFYVKLWVVQALLPEFPYLYLCDVQYERAFTDQIGDTQFNETLDRLSHTRTPGRVDFRLSAHNALPAQRTELMGRPIPASAVARGPSRPWLAWPALYQWDGQGRAPLGNPVETVTWAGAPRTIRFDRGQTTLPNGKLLPTANWFVDYESALVDDPAFPISSPRVALGGGAQAMVVRVDPAVPPPRADRQGRRAITTWQLDPPLAGPNTPLVEQAVPNGLIAAGLRPQFFQAGADLFLVSPRRAAFDLQLETHRLIAGTMQPVASAILSPQAGARIPLGMPWVIAARAADDVHVFAAADDGTLLTSHARPDATAWPPLEVHADRIVHQYSELTASVRGGSNVDVFFIGADRALHTAWWNPARLWPARTDYVIGPPEWLLPTTALEALSPNANSVLVFGVGFDLRLRVASWAPGSWLRSTPIGAEDELLAAHTRLAVAWHPDRAVCEVLAVANDLQLCLYTVASAGGNWVAARPRERIFAPVPDRATRIAPSAPNPFGDLCLWMVGGRRVAIALFAEAGGSVARLATCPLGADPVADNWTNWQSL